MISWEKGEHGILKMDDLQKERNLLKKESEPLLFREKAVENELLVVYLFSKKEYTEVAKITRWSNLPSLKLT